MTEYYDLPDILFINTINMCVICFNFQCQYMPPSSSHFFETPHYVTISVPWSVRHNQVGQQLLRSDISQHYSSPGHFRHLIRVIRRNDMTNKNTNTKITTKTMTNTFRAILETFDQSDKKTWPDQQKDNKNTPPIEDFLRFLKTFREHPQMAILGKFSDNWEPQNITIIVTAFAILAMFGQI